MCYCNTFQSLILKAPLIHVCQVSYLLFLSIQGCKTLSLDLKHDLFLDDNDGNSRVAKTAALSVALKTCPDRVYGERFQDKLNKCIIYNLGSDKVR